MPSSLLTLSSISWASPAQSRSPHAQKQEMGLHGHHIRLPVHRPPTYLDWTRATRKPRLLLAVERRG